MKYLFSKFLFTIALVAAINLLSGCSESEEPVPVEIENSLYINFTLDGVEYKSEIPEERLIPNSGFEKIEDNSPGMNFLFYNYFDHSMAFSFTNKCSETIGRNCINLIFYPSQGLKVGTYPSIWTNGIFVNGVAYTLRYNGPEISPNPSELAVKMEITKFDELKNIMEGSLDGKFYKQNDPSLKVFSLKGKFRIKIYKG